MKYEKLNMKDTKNEKPKLEKLPFDEKSVFYTRDQRYMRKNFRPLELNTAYSV